MDIREKIKNKLSHNETLEEAIPKKNPVAEFKKQRAKVLGLSHTAFDTYKNKNGDIFVWDRNKRDFRSTNVINDKVKDFVNSKEVDKFKETFFKFILKNKIDVSKVKTDGLLDKYLVRRFNGESVDHLRDFFFQSMNEISDKKFDKNNFNYEHNDLNDLLSQIGGLVTSHKKGLNETFISVKNDFGNMKAKMMNLTHMGHGTYKNPAGHEFTWDDASSSYKPIKGVTPSNVVQFPDLKQKDGRSRGDYPENPTTPEEDDQINKHYKQQQTINKDKRDSEPKPSKEDPNKDLGFDPFKLLKKPEPKSMFNNPPPGGWTDADKVPQSVNDKIDKQKELIKKNAELLKSQKVYNMEKYGIFKQFNTSYFSSDKDFGKELNYTIDKVMNLKDRKSFLGTHAGGRFKIEIPHPEKDVEQSVSKIKDAIKARLDVKEEPVKSTSYEPDEITGNPDSYVDKKLQSEIKNFASNFKQAIYKYHTDMKYDDKVFDQHKKVQIKYKNKWALIDNNGSGKFMIALENLQDRNGDPVAFKGDVRQVKAYGVPNHTWKLGNVLTGKYKADFHGGTFSSEK
jgi:hypothetical protein